MAGGGSRITNDQRFNYGPTYTDSNREVVYLSIEPNYPPARPQLSTVKFDGALPTGWLRPLHLDRLRSLLKIGLPTAGQLLMECSAFTVAAIMMGPRKDYARQAILPHNVPFTPDV